MFERIYPIDTLNSWHLSNLRCMEVYQDFKYQRVSGTPIENVGDLRFLNVPTTMAFQSTKIPAHTTMIPRIDADWKITIEDDRDVASSWTLSATIKKQLIPSDASKPTIWNAFVYIDEDGSKYYLSENTPKQIKSSIHGPTLCDVTWDDDKGLLWK